MLIGIDARLNAYRRGGIPQYTRQLLTALAPLAPHEGLISLQHPEQLRPIVVAPNVRRHPIYTPPHHRLEQLTLPLELLPLRLDLLHTPDFIPPLRRPCPAVTTIHDLAFLHFPEILDDAARRYYGQVRQAVHRAEGVIAVSQATRADIAALLDLDPSRVDVIYEAAAPAYQPLELAPREERVINQQLLQAGTFALFVSTLEPRKNMPLLLRALRTCIDRRPGAGYRLVVVGGRGWRYEAIFEALAELRLSDHVLFLDSVAGQDLVWLYNACRLYAMPSIYEGFGLPLLEAMSCGAACLAADTSSLPEVAGDGALLLPHDDAIAWADTIEALWQDDTGREALGRRAIERAGAFSWRRAARETLVLYRQVVEGRPRHTEPLPVAGSEANTLEGARPAEAVVAEEELAREVAAPTIGAVGAATPQSEVGPEVPAAVVGRPCLRCATPLQPEELQHALMLRSDGQQARAPRLWVCPACGYAELVVEHLDHTPDAVVAKAKRPPHLRRARRRHV